MSDLYASKAEALSLSQQPAGRSESLNYQLIHLQKPTSRIFSLAYFGSYLPLFEMPGVPSYKGCDACRKQKKKVRHYQSRRGLLTDVV